MAPLLLFWIAGAAPAPGQSIDPRQPDTAQYRLQPQDEISVTVFDEPELNVSQRLDPRGRISMPLLGTVNLSGMSPREAEAFIENKFIEEKYLLRPQVTVSIINYSPRYFYIFGQVQSPGAKAFPAAVEFLDIINAISRGGDFTDTAKKNSVRVTRKTGPEGEKVMVWNLDGLIQGSEDSIEARKEFRIYPGDVIFVPERIF